MASTSSSYALHDPSAPPVPPQDEPRGGGPAPGPATATLLVRHLPEAIPDEMLSRLFSHYGASSVRPCAGGRLRNCAFVDFKDEMLANQALSQLNRHVILRLRFLGKVLIVERANQGNLKNSNQHQHHQDQLVKGSSHPPISLLKDSSKNTNNLTHGGEPIAPRLGVDYSFPPHLEYEYPPPDGNILTNIVNALIAVPRFYTQVLHLMNKMNIPAPFRMALPTPPLPPQVPAPPPPPPPPSSTKPQLTDLSSDESEMESSDEDRDDTSRRKRAKREAIVGPAVDKGVAHEAVGLKPAMLVPKEVLKIKKKNPVLQIKIGSKPMQKEIAEHENNTKELAREEEHLQQKHFATPQEIESGKLPPEEILSLPMFKNYTPGNPAAVLYIKNLAKDVVPDDFYFIFGKYSYIFEASSWCLSGSLFESVDAARSGLHIKLMQNLANGYVFKGKAMIIQFGRNPVAGKAT
ncbi:U11/U12 small nuclear ribonucleoprotein 65 kDa protein [Ananas comosus]|uniref:U11/U12 small nuclear ribonucleoprotein 65 kDa protein n=1 Tax=Ananas comosus TaxID=4615 RepID=A0A199VGG1_ANACO|nr:U11/U12 small nuclear ribonucleoprotein 65 kDa protein [Ananas comosus]